jgi:hypothetical protein
MKYVMFIYQPEAYDPKALGEDEYKAVAAQYAAVGAPPNLRAGLPCGFSKRRCHRSCAKR